MELRETLDRFAAIGKEIAALTLESKELREAALKEFETLGTSKLIVGNRVWNCFRTNDKQVTLLYEDVPALATAPPPKVD